MHSSTKFPARLSSNCTLAIFGLNRSLKSPGFHTSTSLNSSVSTSSKILVPPSALHQHYDTTPPPPSLYQKANKVFTQKPAQLLWSTTHFRNAPTSSTSPAINDITPEVALMGRSNVGKSSLLNALFRTFDGRGTAAKSRPRTSKHAGCTRTMNAYGIGNAAAGSITVLDMPGYGYRSSAQWGQEITKYLLRRRALRRVFLLIDANHGLKDSDRAFVRLLRTNGVTFQILLAKVDKVLFNAADKSAETGAERLKEIMKDIWTEVCGEELGPGPPALGEIWGCAAKVGPGGRGTLGIEGVRTAILRATGIE